jgi:hypothetical protein
VIFFVGVAVNSVAVARWVRKPRSTAAISGVSFLDVAAFAVATLLPGLLALALRGGVSKSAARRSRRRDEVHSTIVARAFPYVGAGR